MQDKKKLTEYVIGKFKGIAVDSIKKDEFGKALSAISVAAEYLYEYNQYYTDDELEKLLSDIGNCLKKYWKCSQFKNVSSKILVYDGFGLDTRGVILMYLNALGINGYDVVYITNRAVEKNIPTIEALCNKFGFQMLFINMDNYIDWAKELSVIFEKERPRAAFFYTTPYDTSACAVFHMYEGIIDRYLIDLTDHAFWVGKCAADFFLGSRNMSAYLQHMQRGIPKNRMVKLGVNLLVEEYDNHSGLPFEPLDERYIFSGGALYKTLGDYENTYYRIVNHILEMHQEVKFLYAGAGDDKELKKIIEKYPNRAFHIAERKDFYYLISHSVFYLNTYPMFGGMMMKYSALAGKLPITLKHGNDSDGLLLNQKECRIEYDTYEQLINDVDKLLEDQKYLKEREQLLIGSVISEKRFANNLRGVIENHKTDYEHEFVEIDTSTFRKEYYERFGYENQMERMVKIRNLSLFPYFPMVFIKGIINKLFRRVIS